MHTTFYSEDITIHMIVFLFIEKNLRMINHYQNKNGFQNNYHLLKIVSLVSDERTPTSSASESTSLSQLHWFAITPYERVQV